MSKKRRQHNLELKAKVALEALRGIELVHAIAARHAIHPVQVSQWKKELLARLPEVFARKPDAEIAEVKAREDELYRKIGQLEMQLDWLKTNVFTEKLLAAALRDFVGTSLLATPRGRELARFHRSNQAKHGAQNRTQRE